MSERMMIAQDAWKSVPDWLEVLIAACDKRGSSQAKVAKKLGRTPGVISEVLRGRYKGDMADFEERVRDVLLSQEIKCPALGWMDTADCRRWRDEASELKTGPMMVRMFRACQDCPRFTKSREQDDE